MKGSERLKAAVKVYLDRRASEDELFAAAYAKPGKNLDSCVTYICNWVKKTGCNGFEDEEIFSQAVHYYDEDNIDIGKPITNGHIIVNHAIELTEAEKEKARQEAVKKHRDDLIVEMKKKSIDIIEFTPEEKEQIRKSAMDRATQEAYEAMKKKRAKPAKKETETIEQASLF